MSEQGFNEAWSKTLEGIAQTRPVPSPSPRLRVLLNALYQEACLRPPNTTRLDRAIIEVLQFLASSEGKTHDNCWVTSNFLMPGDDYWEADWDDLPEKYVETLGIMGHELWQAVENPEWRESYGGSPEQLLVQFKSTGNADAG